jgi:hypothetical protein
MKAFTKKHYQQISRRLNKKMKDESAWRHEFLCHNSYIKQKADHIFASIEYLSTPRIQDELKSYGLKNFSGGAFSRNPKKANFRRLMLLDFIILSKSKD